MKQQITENEENLFFRKNSSGVSSDLMSQLYLPRASYNLSTIFGTNFQAL